jgi:hypothetical protein
MQPAAARFVATLGLTIKAWPDETTVAVFSPDSNVRTHLISDFAGQLLQWATLEAVSLEQMVDATVDVGAKAAVSLHMDADACAPGHSNESERAQVQQAVEATLHGLVRIGLLRQV